MNKKIEVKNLGYDELLDVLCDIKNHNIITTQDLINIRLIESELKRREVLNFLESQGINIKNML